MIPLWAEKCSEVQLMSCLWISVARRYLTDCNDMESVHTVLVAFLVSSFTQDWITHPHLAHHKLPSSVCLWVSVPCLCDWQRAEYWQWNKHLKQTDLASTCSRRAVSPAAAQWITGKLPATAERCHFFPFVLGCFLHSSFHLCLVFLSQNYFKKKLTSHHQQSANYTGNELRQANVLILRETLVLRETSCSSQPFLRLMPGFWERVCQVKVELFPMGYMQSGVKSPQVPFNDSLACSEHLQWHFTRVGDQIEAAGRWSPPHCRLGQPGWLLCASCSSLLL